MSVVRKTNNALSNRPLEFIFSTEDVDAYDDVISQSGWDLSDFVKNPIALLGHDPNFPVGKWRDVRVEGGKLRGHLQMAPEGTSPRIDEVRRLVDADILQATSVGFVPLAAEPRHGSKKGGVRYLKQILREVSLVSLPANAGALRVQAERLGTSTMTLRTAFGQTVNASLAERQERAHAKAEELLAAQRAKRARAHRARTNPADDSFDPFSLDGLTHDERIAVLRAKAEMPFAVPERKTEWDAEPSLYFCGKPIYSRKNKFGW